MLHTRQGRDEDITVEMMVYSVEKSTQTYRWEEPIDDSKGKRYQNRKRVAA